MPLRYTGRVSAALAETILSTLRQYLQLSIGVIRYQPIGDDEVWRIDVSDAKSERWAASHPDYYKAAVMLAELVGFDLRDG